MLSSITRFLSRFFLRRNVTDQPPTRDLNRMFMDLISHLDSKDARSDDLEKEVRRFLISRSASDDVFKERLSGDIYLENTGATRYILSSLEERSMTKETWRDLWKQEPSGGKMYYTWTIEHIFPEGDNIPKAWVEMVAGGNKELASELREMYCHKLGNLTLTGYNSNLSNMSFEKKRDRLDKNSNPIGYRNGLSLNTDLAIKDSWTVDDIGMRTEKMVSEIMTMFKLETDDD